MNIEKVPQKFDERPAYRILDVAGFFGPNDRLYELNEEIYFDGEPSLEMEPLNEVARQKMIALHERLEARGREVAEKLNRPYVGLPRSLDGALDLASALQRREMGVMGVKDKEVTSVETLRRDETVQYGDTGKRKAGRPRKVG